MSAHDLHPIRHHAREATAGVHRTCVRWMMVLIAAWCGLGTLSLVVRPAEAVSAAYPICFVLALGFSAVLAPGGRDDA